LVIIKDRNPLIVIEEFQGNYSSPHFFSFLSYLREVFKASPHHNSTWWNLCTSKWSVFGFTLFIPL